MSKIARKIQKLRKAEPTARHVRLYRWEIYSGAYRSLDLYARCLLVELKALYNGANNGDLYMSLRDATRKLSTGMHQATAAFRQLVDRGFIKARQRGAFQWKQRHATCWLLTEYDCDVTGHKATKDFMQWRPESDPKGKRRMPLRQQMDAAPAADSRKLEPSAAAPAADSPEMAAQAAAAPASQIVYQGIPSEESAPELRAAHPADGPRTQSKIDLTPPTSQKRFGPWLGQRRNDLGVQMRELADALGIRVSDLYDIETGSVQLAVTARRRAVEFLKERAA